MILPFHPLNFSFDPLDHTCSKYSRQNTHIFTYTPEFSQPETLIQIKAHTHKISQNLTRGIQDMNIDGTSLHGQNQKAYW